MIRAVVFDVGGVLELDPDGREPTERMAAWLEQWDEVQGLKPGTLFDHLIAHHHEAMVGGCNFATWAARLRATSGMDDTAFARFMTEYWDHYLGVLNQSLFEYLRALRPLFMTALLTNSFLGAREKEEARYSFSDAVDFSVYSHEEGVAKPDVEIYRVTAERLAVAPDEIVFLDDVVSYIDGARRAGWHAVLYRSNAEAIAELEACIAEQAD